MSKVRVLVSLSAMIGLLAVAGVAAVHCFPLRTSVRVGAMNSEGLQGAVQSKPVPKALLMVPPHYPEEAKKARIQGNVVLRATIEKDGTVSNLKVQSGDPMLAKAAVEGVQKWRYAPMQKAMTTDLTIHFTLRK